ncbi:MAG: hypothetical protein WCJ58_05930 [bacterium]
MKKVFIGFVIIFITFTILLYFTYIVIVPLLDFSIPATSRNFDHFVKFIEYMITFGFGGVFISFFLIVKSRFLKAIPILLLITSVIYLTVPLFISNWFPYRINFSELVIVLYFALVSCAIPLLAFLGTKKNKMYHKVCLYLLFIAPLLWLLTPFFKIYSLELLGSLYGTVEDLFRFLFISPFYIWLIITAINVKYLE